jgi:hypothetical protein
LLPTATSFLAVLTNPLNVTLLSSQILASPAIWDHQIDLHTCRRILSVFNTAAIGIIQNEAADEPRAPYARRGLDREAWLKAVVDGADDKSPRWRHLILLAGVLLGFEGQNRQGLPRNLRYKLESALAQATQLALQEDTYLDGIAGCCITMVLNYTFEFLSDQNRSRIDYDRLLPLMLSSTFTSSEGLDKAYFVGTADRDIIEGNTKKFGWSPESMTYQHVKNITARPLVASLGPLSRLIAHAMENVTDPNIVADGMSFINDFARTLLAQWRQNKLSEVDPSEETEFLNAESLKSTIPDLWRLLRSSMFSIVIILRAVLGRMLNDRVLAAGSGMCILANNPQNFEISAHKLQWHLLLQCNHYIFFVIFTLSPLALDRIPLHNTLLLISSLLISLHNIQTWPRTFCEPSNPLSWAIFRTTH